MSKRPADSQIHRAPKRPCIRVSRKRRREEDETFAEAERVVRARMEPVVTADPVVAALRAENARLRHFLGRVGRLGMTLKLQRDFLLQQQETTLESLPTIAVR